MDSVLNFFCCGKSEGLPTFIQVIFGKFKALIINNILDRSFLLSLINFLINNLNPDTITTFENSPEEILNALKRELIIFYEEIRVNLIKEYTLQKYFQLVNLTLFFLNLFSCIKYEIFYKVFLDKTLTKLLTKLLKFDNHVSRFYSLLISTLYDENGEVAKLIQSSNNKQLIDSFQTCRDIILIEFPINPNNTIQGINEIQRSIYKMLIDKILNIEFSYESIFSDKSGTIPSDEKSVIKITLTSAIIRIVFSPIKERITNDKKFEINFLTNLVKKCVTYYFEKFGDNVNCLFRREEVADDLIKYLFFTRGNMIFFETMYKQIDRAIVKYDEIEFLSIEEIKSLYAFILNFLEKSIPDSLKIVLKLIKENVRTIYNTENYTAVLTILFFNFLLSPKLQDIYGINPGKNPLIKNLNKLIRNICFNEKFKEEDSLSYYNDLILPLHLETKSTIEKIIDSFPIDDIDYLLKNEVNATFLNSDGDNYNSNKINKNDNSINSALFFLDCDYVISVFETALGDNLTDISEPVQFVENLMQNRRKTFFMNIDFEDFKKLKILESSSIIKGDK